MAHHTQSEKHASSSGWKLSTFDAKIVLLGHTGVGKTSVALRYVQDIFTDHSSPTIGASFLTKRIVLDDVRIKLQIWDTAGQERFRSLAPMYYRGACAAILVYDITQYDSFQKVQDWVNELKTNVREEIVLAIVGNKLDLEHERGVSVEDAKQYAKEIRAFFTETSAKSGSGVEALFANIAGQLTNNRKETPPQLTKPPEPMIDPSKARPEVEESGCC